MTAFLLALLTPVAFILGQSYWSMMRRPELHPIPYSRNLSTIVLPDDCERVDRIERNVPLAILPPQVQWIDLRTPKVNPQDVLDLCNKVAQGYTDGEVNTIFSAMVGLSDLAEGANA